MYHYHRLLCGILLPTSHHHIVIIMAIGFKDDACQTNETHSRSQVHSTGQFDSSLIPRDETALAAQILFHDFYRCAFINQGVVLRDDPLPDQR